MRLLHTLLFLIASVAECLMLSRVSVPQYKLVGEEALLKCDYDLGRDRLYAVKWYKDNEEFFRYVPRFNPPIYTHPVEGVRVESSKSNDKRVFLRNLIVRSTGVYRCEVSAEAPSFASIQGEGRMTVVYLPKEAPQITGVNLREEYEVGDVLDLNCTSAKSFPPAKLTWYINDSPVEVPWSISLHPAPTDPPQSSSQQHNNGHHHHHHGHHHQNRYTTMASTTYNSYLMISTLRLQLPLEGHHFGRKGTAKVRCVARISPLFWQDGDERVLGQNKKDDQEEDYEDGGSLEERGRHRHHHTPPEVEFEGSHHQNFNYGGEVGEGEEEEEDDHYFYGIAGNPAFQREALVLVKGGGCSIMKGRGEFAVGIAYQLACWFLIKILCQVC